MPPFVDLSGRKVGLLTIIRRGTDNPKGVPRWICRCDCGNETMSSGQSLREGKIESCGCKRDERSAVRNKERAVHGLAHTRVWRIWQQMKQRCLSPATTTYVHYGAKGLTVSDRWMDFQKFLEDMGQPPTEKHTLDRIDGTKGYSFENCRWATMKEQNNNRKDNHILEFNGQSLTIAQWADKLGLKAPTIYARINVYKWSVKRALTTPAAPYMRHR